MELIHGCVCRVTSRRPPRSVYTINSSHFVAHKTPLSPGPNNEQRATIRTYLYIRTYISARGINMMNHLFMSELIVLYTYVYVELSDKED